MKKITFIRIGTIYCIVGIIILPYICNCIDVWETSKRVTFGLSLFQLMHPSVWFLWLITIPAIAKLMVELHDEEVKKNKSLHTK